MTSQDNDKEEYDSFVRGLEDRNRDFLDIFKDSNEAKEKAKEKIRANILRLDEALHNVYIKYPYEYDRYIVYLKHRNFLARLIGDPENDPEKTWENFKPNPAQRRH